MDEQGTARRGRVATGVAVVCAAALAVECLVRYVVPYLAAVGSSEYPTRGSGTFFLELVTPTLAVLGSVIGGYLLVRRARLGIPIVVGAGFWGLVTAGGVHLLHNEGGALLSAYVYWLVLLAGLSLLTVGTALLPGTRRWMHPLADAPATAQSSSVR